MTKSPVNSIAIIYHDADFDGKLSNEVCRFHLEKSHPEASIDSYGWDYGRPVPLPADWPSANTGNLVPSDWQHYDVIYIVDLSVDALMDRADLREKIIWIDHHKSAMATHDIEPDREGKPEKFKGIRIDGVAACRLCWAWFTWGKLPEGVLPSKQDVVVPLTKSVFVDREISEPELIRLAGEYDVWDHRDIQALPLQFGLRALPLYQFEGLVYEQLEGTDDGNVLLYEAINNGRTIMDYCDQQNDEYSAANACTIKFEGLTVCALNIGQRGSSALLKGGLKPEHEAGLVWRYDGKQVSVSLYHVPGHEDKDLSLIAKKYLGGGHRGACGFRCSLSRIEDILQGGVA